MSLDVYLTSAETKKVPISESAIFIREDGQIRKLSRDEWDERFPGVEPIEVETPQESEDVYWANITHNLNTMAGEAGIYKHLWRPEEVGVEFASQLIEPLEKGLALLKSDPKRFKQFNPENGWGDYDGLVSFVHRYLQACKEYPDATVYTSR